MNTVSFPHHKREDPKSATLPPSKLAHIKKSFAPNIQLSGNKLENANESLKKFSTTTSSAFLGQKAPYFRVDQDVDKYMRGKFPFSDL